MKDSFTSLDETFRLEVRLGDKKKIAVTGKGTVKIHTRDNGYKLLDDVYYSPKLEYNLLSVGQLMKKGYAILFDDDECAIISKETGKIMTKVLVLSNNMFVLHPTRITQAHAHLTKVDDDTLRWHCRFGHLYFDGLKHLHNKKDGVRSA